MPPSDDLRAELQRRQNFKAAVLALFKSRPNEWIDASDLARVGGAMAWRTRVADARRVVQRDGGVIENQQSRAVMINADGRKHVTGPVVSKYRYVPTPTSWPVFDAPSQEPWTLKP